MSGAADLYDIAVIGGGINGCGIARDLAGRGLRVALLEKGDLGGGTSSGSTKLIHGGLRYLEHYEFALVRESLIERERLWKIAPHIIWPMRFVLPHHSGLRPKWLIRLGLFLYDHLGGRKLLPATKRLNLRQEPAGAVLKEEYRTAFEYSDCWVDDARLVVLNARDAANNGASILPRSEVIALSRDNGVWQITRKDAEPIHAKAVMNAAGPSVLALLDRTAGLQDKPDSKIRLVRGSHIVVRKLFDSPQAYFFQNADGRIFFAIPYEEDFTLIGTTDAEHAPGDPIAASPQEIEYLCKGASEYFRKSISPADVVWSYAGVRPLVDDGSGKPENATRGYRLDVDTDSAGQAPIVSIFGGKITTYRHLAERAVAELRPWFAQASGKSWTADKPLPGGDFAVDGVEALSVKLARDYPFLVPATVRRLIRCYGTLAWDWLDKAEQPSDLGRDFGEGLCQAEVDYLVAKEWAKTADDILWRRSKLGLRLTAEQRVALDAYLVSNSNPK
jgi:glycerol-3-phosphate dehydrogenase